MQATGRDSMAFPDVSGPRTTPGPFGGRHAPLFVRKAPRQDPSPLSLASAIRTWRERGTRLERALRIGVRRAGPCVLRAELASAGGYSGRTLQGTRGRGLRWRRAFS